MKDFYFNCHGCGKCCNSPPTFEFSHFMEYSKDFIISLAVNKSYVEYAGLSDSEKRVVNFAEKHHPAAYCKDYSYIYQVYPLGYSPVSENKCPQKKDNGECGIYLRRPTRCKTVPFDASLPSTMQLRNVPHLKREGCLVTKKKVGFIKIYSKNEIVDQTFKRYRNSELKDFIEWRDLVIAYIEDAKHNGIEFREQQMSCPIPFLLLMLAVKKCTKEQVFNFFKDQIILIEDKIKVYEKNEPEYVSNIKRYMEMYKQGVDMLNTTDISYQP